MNKLTTMLVIAAVALASGTAFAQTSGEDPSAKTEAPTKVYHAGGKHDQRAHEATLRARARGETMATNGQHAGGRHDVKQHEAAMNAEARKSESATTK